MKLEYIRDVFILTKLTNPRNFNFPFKNHFLKIESIMTSKSVFKSYKTPKQEILYQKEIQHY